MSGLSTHERVTLAAEFLGARIKPEATYLANLIAPAVERIIAAREAGAAQDAAQQALRDAAAGIADAELHNWLNPSRGASVWLRARADALVGVGLDRLLDDYDPVPGLVARGVVADPEQEEAAAAQDAAQQVEARVLDNLTDEQRQHALAVCGQVIELAAAKDASGRSSMPIYIDDALLLAGVTLAALTTLDGTP